MERCAPRPVTAAAHGVCLLRQMHDPALDRRGRGLGSVDYAELLQDVSHVELDGHLCEVEGLGDLLVGIPLNDQPQDFKLSLAEARLLLTGREFRRDRRGETSLPARTARMAATISSRRAAL